MALIDILQKQDVISYAAVERASEAKIAKLHTWSHLFE
jgi:hypothetical protein